MIFEPAGLDGPLRTDATITLRSAPGVDVGAAAREIAASLDRSLPLGLVMTMEEAIDEGLAQWNVLARLLTALAIVAGVLSAVGLYAVVSFGVAARRREFGIRMALGAEPAVVRGLVLRGTAIITAVGLIVGLGGAVALARVLEEQPVRRAAIRSGPLDDRGGDSRCAGVCRLDRPRAARDARRRRGDATGALIARRRPFSPPVFSEPPVMENFFLTFLLCRSRSDALIVGANG